MSVQSTTQCQPYFLFWTPSEDIRLSFRHPLPTHSPALHPLPCARNWQETAPYDGHALTSRREDGLTDPTPLADSSGSPASTVGPGTVHLASLVTFYTSSPICTTICCLHCRNLPQVNEDSGEACSILWRIWALSVQHPRYNGTSKSCIVFPPPSYVVSKSNHPWSSRAPRIAALMATYLSSLVQRQPLRHPCRPALTAQKRHVRLHTAAETQRCQLCVS
jgi:hypothetical protein